MTLTGGNLIDVLVFLVVLLVIVYIILAIVRRF